MSRMEVLGNVMGSVLWVLCYEILPGLPAEHIANMWMECQGFGAEHPGPRRSQYTNLTLNMFTHSQSTRADYPKLRGRAVEATHVVPALLFVVKQHMCNDTPLHKHMCACMKQLLTFDQLLDENASMFMTAAESTKLNNTIDAFLVHYSLCANVASAQHQMLFNVTITCHYLIHVGEQSVYIHPRAGACVIDEDFVKGVKHMSRNCGAGTTAYKAVLKIVEHYSYGLHFRCCHLNGISPMPHIASLTAYHRGSCMQTDVFRKWSLFIHI